MPRYDATDVFVLSGAEDLVPVGPGRYRPRTEGLFARIEHRELGQTLGGPRQGRAVSTYGTPGATGTDPAAIADPDDPTRVFAWRITETTDPFGNPSSTRYDARRVGDEPATAGTSCTCAEIRYADYGDPADPRSWSRCEFDYEPRPDPFSDYRAGFEIRTVLRCAGDPGRPRTPADGVSPGARATALSYAPGAPTTGSRCSPGSTWSGRRRRPRAEALPPLEFGYTGVRPGAAPVLRR